MLKETRQLGIDEIKACDDLATLLAWYEELDERDVELKSFATAYNDFDAGDDAWAERNAGALAYVRISARWVERRILVLGGQPPYQPTDPRSKEITKLTEALRKAKAELARQAA